MPKIPEFKGLGKIDSQSIIRTRLCSGSVKKMLRLSKNTIKMYLDPNSVQSAKVGKTTNPKSRSSGYQEYNSMILLCQTTSKDRVIELEDKLIQFMMENYPKLTDNLRKGSAGKPAGTSQMHRIYLVLR